MKRYSFLILCLAIVGCIRSLFPQPELAGDDRSISFPQFFEHPAIKVGPSGQTYELDGVTLRAISIAANDFLPPGRANPPCVNRQEAHVYRLIRQGEIIFIRIDENPQYCGKEYAGLDSGAKYAISTDGRILRRAFDGRDPYEAPSTDGIPVVGEPGVSPNFDPNNIPPLPFMRRSLQDAGTVQDAGTDGGTPLIP